jgi:hypothetical protein
MDDITLKLTKDDLDLLMRVIYRMRAELHIKVPLMDKTSPTKNSERRDEWFLFELHKKLVDQINKQV